MKTDHILIIRFSAMGDVAMTVPVVDSLARQYPDVRITMLSRPFVRPFFEHMPPNVGVMEADLNREYKGMMGLNALYRRLTAKNFTAIADLHNVLRSDYLRMRFNMDRYRVEHIDKHRAGRKALVAYSGKQLVQQPTPFDNYADVFRRLGYPIKLDFSSIFPPEGGDMSELPHALDLPKGKERWIGIAPFAAHVGKAYPTRLMEEAITNLIDHHPDSRIFLFGGKNDNLSIFKTWCAKYSQCVSVPEYVRNLRQELVLMSHLDVMVSMDSANMHMASIVGTTVVSVWGATHPFAGFLGWNQKMENVVQIDLPCRPCSIFGNKLCLREDYACLKNISPELIVAKVDKVLSEKPLETLSM